MFLALNLLLMFLPVVYLIETTKNKLNKFSQKGTEQK